MESLDFLCFGFHEIGAVLSASLLLHQLWCLWKNPNMAELGWVFALSFVTLDFFERLHQA